MFFYRFKIVDTHLNTYAHQLHQWYLLGKTEKVNSIRKLHIHRIFNTKTKEWTYFVVDTSVAGYKNSLIKSSNPHPVVIGFCELVKRPGWVALETVMLYVSPESRGKGIATFLYDSIMKDGNIVISGYSHNLKSQKLWMKIVRNKNYMTWAHDINNLESYCPVCVENNKFECNLKLYEDIYKMRRRKRPQDVRIIAFNPRYVS